MVAFALFLSACGGGGGGNNNPPPTASVSANPATITVGQTTTLTWSCGNSTSATASGDWSGSKALTGHETVTPATSGTKTYTITCSGSGGNVSASAQVTVNDLPVPPTASISPPSATVPFGETKNFSCPATGVPAPTVSWSTDIGSVSASGVYTPPTTQPSQFLATVTCTATNGSGPPASSSATVTLVSKMVSATPMGIYCAKASCVKIVRVVVKGFFPGTTTFDSSPKIFIGPPINDFRGFIESFTTVSSDTYDLSMVFDTNRFDPGPIDIWSTNPSPGGGESNHLQVVFKGNLNTGAVASSKIFQLDQAAKKVWQFDANGNLEKSFDVGTGARGIAADGDFLAVSSGTAVNTYRISGSGIASGVAPNGGAMGVALGGGYACFAEDTAGTVSCYDPSVINPVANSVSVGNSPVSVAIAEIDGTWYCVAFDTSNFTIYLLRLPDLQLVRAVTLTGLTPASDLHLAVFRSGSQLGVAAVLDPAGKTIVFVDLRTGQEIRRVAFDGDALRIAADNTNGKVVIAFYDHVASVTRFGSIDPSNGGVNNLTTTADNVPIALTVSPDGTKTNSGNRSAVVVVNNQ